MKNKIFSYCLVFGLLLAFIEVNAQNMGLKIGDQVPDFAIPKIINPSSKITRFSDFKEDLIIVDFWSTNCGGCVAALPKMDSLQKQFGSRIKILPVTFEQEAHVLSFLAKNKYTKGITVESVVEDKVFRSYFKHLYIPHEVWIYKGKVIAVTEPEYVDAWNITRLLEGKRNNWPVKNDFYIFDQNKPLFEEAESGYVRIGGARTEFSSSLLPGRSEIIRDPVKKTVRFYMLNNSIAAIYMIEWGNINKGVKLNVPPGALWNQFVWEVSDTSKYIYYRQYGYRQDWMAKNAICFESQYPDTGQNDQQVYERVIADLGSLLGLKVRWEKRKEKVLVLRKTSDKDLFLKRAGLSGQFAVGDIGYFMNMQIANPYVFNETGYTGEGVMKLNIPSWTDVPAIRKAIQSYGLDLNEEERLVDKFVFSELKKQ